MILPKLSAIELEGPSTGDVVGQNIFLPLSLLPSIQRVSALGVRTDEHLDELPPPYIDSIISHLSFANCLIQPEAYTQLFKGLRVLTSFNYHGQEETRFEEPEVQWFRRMLLGFAKDTLKSLTIYSFKQVFMGSLQDFKVLQRLSTSVELLQHPGRRTMTGVLPPALEAIKLYGDEGQLNHSDLFDDILALKQEEVALLCSVTFVSCNVAHMTLDTIHRLKRYLDRGYAKADMHIQLHLRSKFECEAEQIAEVLSESGRSERLG